MKEQPSTQCRTCGTNNISKYVNNFSSKNPYNSNFEFSSKRILTRNPNLIFFFCGGGGGGCRGGCQQRR